MAIGDGCHAKIHHPWINGLPPVWKNQETLSTDRVSSLKEGSGSWDLAKCTLLFSDETVKNIQNLPLTDPGCEDIIVWKGNKSGNYTVKSGYKMLFDSKKHFNLESALREFEQTKLETILEAHGHSKTENFHVENF